MPGEGLFVFVLGAKFEDDLFEIPVAQVSDLPEDGVKGAASVLLPGPGDDFHRFGGWGGLLGGRLFFIAQEGPEEASEQEEEGTGTASHQPRPDLDAAIDFLHLCWINTVNDFCKS